MSDYFTYFNTAGELLRIAFPADLPLAERDAFMAAPPADAEAFPVHGYAPPLEVPAPAPAAAPAVTPAPMTKAARKAAADT